MLFILKIINISMYQVGIYRVKNVDYIKRSFNIEHFDEVNKKMGT